MQPWRMVKSVFWTGIFYILLGFSGSWAEPAAVDLQSSFAEEAFHGEKIKILEMKFSEVVTSDRNFFRTDLEKNKKRCLKLRTPILIDSKGHPYPLQFIGREVKQVANNNILKSELTFKYKHPSLSEWTLEGPILVEFDGKIFKTYPAVQDKVQRS